MNIQTSGWDDGEEKYAIWDNIVICNLFVYGEDAIQIESFDPGHKAYLKLKQFCFAKGIVNSEWINDNPYILDNTTI